MASSHRNSAKLEQTLESFIENMRQINLTVSNFEAQGQTVFNQKVKKIVTDLQDIDKLKNDLMNVQIPMEVFEYIDKGRNPQLYSQNCISKAAAKNEEVKGKIDSYKKFKAHMLVELSKTFPREMNSYRMIRRDSI